MLRKNFLILAFSIIASVSFALPKTEDLEKIAAQNRARVGVAILPEEEEAILLNNDERYPLMSVFKLHVAIAALKRIENENLDLSEKIFVSEKDISKNTYSPLLKKYPNGNFEISIGETIAYAIIYSDSTTAAILGVFEPLTAVFVGVVMLGEPFTLNLAAGILIIIFAVAIVIYFGSDRRAFRRKVFSAKS